MVSAAAAASCIDRLASVRPAPRPQSRGHRRGRRPRDVTCSTGTPRRWPSTVPSCTSPRVIRRRRDPRPCGRKAGRTHDSSRAPQQPGRLGVTAPEPLADRRGIDRREAPVLGLRPLDLQPRPRGAHQPARRVRVDPEQQVPDLVGGDAAEERRGRRRRRGEPCRRHAWRRRWPRCWALDRRGSSRRRARASRRAAAGGCAGPAPFGDTDS